MRAKGQNNMFHLEVRQKMSYILELVIYFHLNTFYPSIKKYLAEYGQFCWTLQNNYSINQIFSSTEESIYLLQYIIRPDIVVEDSEGKKWKIALTVAALLTLIGILSAVLTLQLNKKGMLNFNLFIIY